MGSGTNGDTVDRDREATVLTGREVANDIDGDIGRKVRPILPSCSLGENTAGIHKHGVGKRERWVAHVRVDS
jgi:hypothetical protein